MNSSPPQSVSSLEAQLSEPTDDVVEVLRRLEGDIAFLGVGGKMGPTMARMAQRAREQAGSGGKIYGVSRFSDSAARERLEAWGVKTVACDLLDPQAYSAIPECPHIIYLVGFKFGASQAASLTWAINCQVPALVCRRFPGSRIVAMSSGNVYGMVPSDSSGSRETDELHPVGEYAMAALGRERTFEFFSTSTQTPVSILRLNYATELRYGVLVDIARVVYQRQLVSLQVPAVNVIWLRDANCMSLAALEQCSTPASVINVAGGDLVSVRDIALAFGKRWNLPVQFSETEGHEALLSDGKPGHQLLGEPPTDLETMLDWTADWVANDRPLLGKPTHFQVRDGKF